MAMVIVERQIRNVPLIVIDRRLRVSFERAQLDALEPYKVDGIGWQVICA